MWVAFALQKLLTFFSKKYQNICVSLDLNFNESLTNDIVSFEQLGPAFASPEWFLFYHSIFNIKTTPPTRPLLGSYKCGLYNV